jgi:PKD repeat protein
MTWRWKMVAGAASLMFLAACTPLPPNAPPVASFFVDPAGGYAPLEIEVNAAASADPDGSIRSWEWDYGDGSETGKGATCLHVYSDDGTYTVELCVRDDRGAETTTSADVRVLNPPPVVQVEASPWYGLSPLTVTFDAGESYDPSGEITAFAWDFGDGSGGSGPQVAHTFTADSTQLFAVIVTATDDDGDTSDAAVPVTVQGATAENAPPLAVFTVSPAAGVAPLTVTLDAGDSYDVDGEVVSYDWRFGDGATGTGETAQHVYTDAGTYRVELTVHDDDGAGSLAGHDVTVEVVIPEPPPPPG